MKFSEYQNELTEAFNRAAPITARRGNQSYFEIDGAEYMIGLYYEEDRKALGVDFMHKPAGAMSYNYSLAKGDSKDAMTVFATVISEIKHVMQNNIVNRITFAAFNDTNRSDSRKRTRLYKRMAERFAKDLGFKLRVSNESEGASFVMERIVPIEDPKPVYTDNPTGYDTEMGTELLDLPTINDAAIVKVTGGDGIWYLRGGHSLNIEAGIVELSAGSINDDVAWYKSFYPLEWYYEPEDELFYDDEQRIAMISGKIWVINGNEITVWSDVSSLEAQSDSKLSQATLERIGA
ncbi:hypothetical protein [Vibrio phage VH7D]|uniref:Uncharacterized protein n=1 Tax=Vibrio phage VH7D TaxID=1262539 RepID=V9LYM0_9CAUD|nr:hypothetical protein CF80_gp005 [Vibrio phage VH7D]AGB06792.1 hypothetical protein [Vibrio phage VH7D]QNJ54599.1 hypothetical protein vBValMR10Z_58 [Vibrio phage vB_ValM_R10Z]QNJ54984.1 hypothetical protein vBValMR11Z_58 [Vibrio phage vB_ValM_R11Z]URQ03698.1 hypothetical protein PVA23_321 [Vibrio phage PVA23]